MNTEQVRALRQSMTGPELRLWKALRGRALGVKFRRQAPIGPYVGDFVCLERRLVVELDGEQHLDSVHDQRRDSFLKAQGYTVLRFWNGEVMRNLSGVLEAIAGRLEALPVRERDRLRWAAGHPHLGHPDGALASPFEGEE